VSGHIWDGPGTDAGHLGISPSYTIAPQVRTDRDLTLLEVRSGQFGGGLTPKKTYD